jgi:hypothetical protein
MSYSQGRVEDYHSTVIVKGLKAALADADIDGALSQFEDSHIKLNKLMYMAAEELGLLDELQHSWHIYGSDLGDLVPSTQSVGPIALQELPQTESPDEPSIDSAKNFPDEEVFYDYYSDDVSLGTLDSLEAILQSNRVDLLDEFYTEYSNEMSGFYELYDSNIDLQRILETYHDAISVGEFGPDDYEEVNRVTSRMRDEFFKHEEFRTEYIREMGADIDSDVSEIFSSYLTLLDDFFYHLVNRDPEDLETDPSHIVSEMKTFYLDRGWKIVTEIISYHTIRGPRRSGLEYGAREEIRKVDATLQIKFERLLSECQNSAIFSEEAGLEDSMSISPDESISLLDSCELLNS